MDRNIPLENANGAIGDSQPTDWTMREIEQQPDIWQEAFALVAEQRRRIDAWLAPVLANPASRIILAGAGSSAFIGQALAPNLTKVLGRPVEAISTTSIVADPESYLVGDCPTLLISFGRSGNSPESIGAARLATQLISDCRHLVVCCDDSSALARYDGGGEDRAFRLLMPPRALDQSFAMTSSFSAMLVSALAAFAWDPDQADVMIAAARALLASSTDQIERIVANGFNRGVFLGSGALQGIATEAALKSLEMSAGERDAYADSPLGFRHGPKFVVDNRTLVVLLTHPSPYTRRYDLELATELERDGAAREIVRLDQHPALSDTCLDAAWLAPVYLIWCQQLGWHAAHALGHSPDNPSPSGTLNRVVQGVTLHPYLGA